MRESYHKVKREHVKIIKGYIERAVSLFSLITSWSHTHTHTHTQKNLVKTTAKVSRRKIHSSNFHTITGF